MNTVKVISEVGLGLGTKVVDVDSGVEIKGIEAIKVMVDDADSVVRVNLTIALAQVDANGKAKYFACHPTTGDLLEVETVIFADGTVFYPGRKGEIRALNEGRVLRVKAG
jgi:hypothetical protein